MICLVCGHEHDRFCDCCDESDYWKEDNDNTQ
nr:MAG TPA: TT viral ORF2 [Caudoviricetes sp.]